MEVFLDTSFLVAFYNKRDQNLSITTELLLMIILNNSDSVQFLINPYYWMRSGRTEEYKRRKAHIELQGLSISRDFLRNT